MNTLIHNRWALPGPEVHGGAGRDHPRGVTTSTSPTDGSLLPGSKVWTPPPRERGVTVVSGASSVPALSAAVIDRYFPQFKRLDSIEFGISSGARAPGLATVRGVFSYGGKPFQEWRDGAWRTTYGWLDLRRHLFPPPLGARWVSSCDIPDLTLFSEALSDGADRFVSRGVRQRAGSARRVWPRGSRAYAAPQESDAICSTTESHQSLDRATAE